MALRCRDSAVPVTTFVLQDDSAGADTVTPILAALETATAAKYTGDVIQDTRVCDEDADYLLVAANITDAERTGALAALHRDNYGVGIYKDEYATLEAHQREAFRAVGESSFQTLHCEQPYAPDGSWNWSLQAASGKGTGRFYGDRVVGLRCGAGPLSAGPLPAGSAYNVFLHGFWIDVWQNIGQIAAHADIRVPNGGSATSKSNYFFDHPIKPGAMSKGNVLQHEHSWIKDGSSNMYTIIEGSGGHNAFGNNNAHKLYDPNFVTLEFAGELTTVDSVQLCRDTPGSTFFDGTVDNGNGAWCAHMPDGSDPTGRIVGTGDFGFNFTMITPLAAEQVKENIAFHGMKSRFYSWNLAPHPNMPTIRHIDFHMLNMRHQSEDDLFDIKIDNRDPTNLISDILINVDQMSRARNAFYLITQQADLDTAQAKRITVQADPNARDGRENIFDIGGFVPKEADSDGHAVGINPCEDFTCQYLKTRRCGGHIIAYAIHYLNAGHTPTTHNFKKLLIANNDVAEHSPHTTAKGLSSSSIGIGCMLDNPCVLDVSGAIIRDNIVRGYDTVPGNALIHPYRINWHDQVIFEGNDGDLGTGATIASNRNQAVKWVDLTGNTGNWNVNDDFEDAANPGVLLATVAKVENAGATPRLYYMHPTDGRTTAPDIASGVTINNLDDTGSGTTNGANGSRGLGCNILMRLSATRRNRLGNSGGTVPWMGFTSGANPGGPDPTDRLTGGVYINESDTDFIGETNDAGIDIPGHAIAMLATYQGFSDTGNSYGSGSQVLAS
jgi:hypothetical protein